MKLFSKLLTPLVLLALLFNVTGCGTKEKNIEGSLEDIMKKVYANVPEEKTPMMLTNIEVTEENAENFLGTSDIDFREALASESMTGSIAHSVVLVRMNDVKDVEEAKKKIEENINPRKWICVGVEKVTVESRGDLIIVILNDELGETISKDFQELGK